VRRDAVSLFEAWEHRVVFAPDPNFPFDVSLYKFENRWARPPVGRGEYLYSVAVLTERPRLTIGITNVLKTCDLKFSLSYWEYVPSRKSIEIADRRYALSLVSLLREHYGESRVKVAEPGW
jgi:hypothetical protein